MAYKPATRKQAKLRLGLVGPAGSGKTWTALAIASGLGSRVALIDSENGSASLYAMDFKFDTNQLESFSPAAYITAIEEAEAAGYDVLVIDSLSHAWTGKDGVLEQVDNATRRSGSKNSYFAWRDVTPEHNQLVDKLIRCRAHLIVTLRSKVEYALETSNGKVTPRKIGMAPIQREGLDYEFSVAGDMDLEHNLNITKTRCSVLAGKSIKKPGKELAKTLRDWLEQGAEEETAAQISHVRDLANPGSQAEKPKTVEPESLTFEKVVAMIKGTKTHEALDALRTTINKFPIEHRNMLVDVAKLQRAALNEMQKAVAAVKEQQLRSAADSPGYHKLLDSLSIAEAAKSSEALMLVGIAVSEDRGNKLITAGEEAVLNAAIQKARETWGGVVSAPAPVATEPAPWSQDGAGSVPVPDPTKAPSAAPIASPEPAQASERAKP